MLQGLERLEELLAGRYAVERELGRGGMATVYLARDLRHPRRVAIKVLRAEHATGIAVDRFRAEIDIAAALTHPNILPVFDSGGAGEHLYYVMPFVEGESLRDRLRRTGRLPVDEAVRITREIADALDYAHSHNVVHRDIKPENILLIADHAVVTDFGIARAIARMGDAQLTGTGLAIGTPLYMSPEQASGDRDVDGRSDIYSLGCVLYEMLDGGPPHVGNTPHQVLARKLTQSPNPLTATRPDVSRALDQAIARALAPEPAQRYATAAELARALGRPSRVVTVQRWFDGRHRVLVLAGIVTTALLLLGAGYAVLSARERRLVGDDGRIGIAVLPFRATMPQTALWGEAIPDLLATTLDGTPGVRVADPWALWRTLRADPQASARSPAPDEGAELARRARACCFILGSITQLERDVNVSIRIYRRGSDEPWQTFSVTGSADGLAELVRRISIEVIQRLSSSALALSPVQFDRGLTRSPGALKEWLSAREHHRRGQIDSAGAAIGRALALDSNFVLALIDAVAIRSWLQFQRGEFYSGTRQLAERAVQLGDSLPDRPRLRAEAMLASINTQGRRAADALDRVLAIDSLDLDAWSLLGYVHTAYGWQYGRSERQAIDVTERAVRIDSTDVPLVVRRLYLALAVNDLEDVDRQLVRVRRLDTTEVVVRGLLRAVESVRIDDARFPALADQLASAPMPDWIAVIRILRTYRPERAEYLAERTRRTAEAQLLRVASGSQVQLFAAEGRWRAVDSLRMSGAFANIPGLDRQVDQLMTAAAVGGAADDEIAKRAATRLASRMQPDSARALLETRPVWLEGWLIGAYHAMYGDTSLALKWHAALGTLPKGGSPREYAAALQADIAARLSARRGDRAAALQHARRALQLWDIHTDNQPEYLPEPAMRFHFAEQLRSAGKIDSAAALFRSLVPPTTWMGFYTPRAALELAEIEEANGEKDNAQRHFLIAMRLWDRGDTSVAQLRARARRGVLKYGELERRGAT